MDNDDNNYVLLLDEMQLSMLVEYDPVAQFSNDRKIYRILSWLTKILRHAKIKFVVRAAIFSKHISACLTIILRNV